MTGTFSGSDFEGMKSDTEGLSALFYMSLPVHLKWNHLYICAFICRVTLTRS